MQVKTKKNASLFLIIIGLVVLASEVSKYLNEDGRNSRLIIMSCAIVIIVCGIISLRNVIKKQNG